MIWSHHSVAALLLALIWLHPAPAQAAGQGVIEGFDGPSIHDVSFEDENALLCVVTSQKVVRTVTLRNNYTEPLANITVIPPVAAGITFTTTQPARRTLKPGQTTTFTVSVLCTQEVDAYPTWQVFLPDYGIGTPITYQTVARHTAIAPANAEWYSYPRETLVYDVSRTEGDYFEPFVAPRTTATEPLSYQWYKDGKPLAGATRRSYPLRRIQFNDGGRYEVRMTNKLGSVLIPYLNLVTYLGSTPTVPVTVNAGAPLTLSAANRVRGAVTVNWVGPNQAPLSIDAQLSLSPTHLRDEHCESNESGFYGFTFTDDAQRTFVAATWWVDVRTRPEFEFPNFSDPDFSQATYQVGTTVEERIRVINAKGVSVKGLPPGLRLVRRLAEYDGEPIPTEYEWYVVGTPTVPGDFAVTLVASNAAGATFPWLVELSVAPLEAGVAGAYVGLADSYGTTLGGPYVRGGLATMTVTANGRFTLVAGNLRCSGIYDGYAGSAALGTYMETDYFTEERSPRSYRLVLASDNYPSPHIKVSISADDQEGYE